MIDPDELRRLLVSEKITHRKKGRVECENKLFRDRLSIACNPSLSMSLLHAATECEITEINLAQTKGKVVEMDLSVFFRNMVKYCTSYGQVKSHKTGFIFEHIIDILCNEDLPVAFKGNHKQALGLLLQPSMVHSISFERSMKMSIIYLKEILIDFTSLKDPLNHKLLRATCMCMFQEESCQLPFVSNVLSWFVKLLQQTSEDSATHALVAATVAECCASFMTFQHLNLYSALSKELEFVFQVVVKYLSSFQYREMHKDAYFSFIDAYLALCTEYFRLAPSADNGEDSICTSSSALVQLSEYLLSEAHLKSLVISMRTHPSSSTVNKDNSYVLLQDVLGEENSKWYAQFVIIVRLLHRLGAGRATSAVDTDNKTDPKTAQTPRNKTNRDEGQTVTVNKRMRVDGTSHTSVPSSNSSNVLATSVPQRALHTPFKSNSIRATPTPTTTNFNLLERMSSTQLDTSTTVASFATPGVRSSNAASSAQSTKQNAALVLESYLVVLLVGLRLFQDGSFISSVRENASKAENSVALLKSVNKYATVLKQILCDVLQYACETQLLGSVLLVLTELHKLNKYYTNTISTSTEHTTSVWMEILTILLTHPKCAAFHSTTSTVRKDTLYAYILQLAHSIYSTNKSTISTLQNSVQLWQYSFLPNPLLIESSAGFEYTASLSKNGNEEVPTAVVNALHNTLQTMGHTELLAVLSSNDYNTTTITTTTSSNTADTTTVHNNIRNGYGIVALVSWLYAQLAPLQAQPFDTSDTAQSSNRSGIQFIASSSCLTRVPVSMVNSYSESIFSLISAVLQPQCRKRTTQVTESVAKLVAVRSNNLHWLDHILDTYSKSIDDTDARETNVDSACNEAQLQLSAALLHTLATQLLTIVASNSLRNEASEQFNAWQSVVLLTINSYAALIDTTTKTYTMSNTNQQDTIDFVTTQLTTVLALIKSCVSYVEKKLIALKLTHVSEYFDTLSSALVLLQPALSVYGSNNADLIRLRTQCGHVLVKCVRAVQTIVLSKANKSAHNDLFNTQHQPSHAIDIDDEFLEHGTTHSSTNRAYIDVDDDMNVSDNGSSNSSSGSRQVMVFSTEQLACYAAIARCVVALQESFSNTCSKRLDTTATDTLTNNATTTTNTTNTLNAIEEGMQKSIDFLFTTQSLNDSVSLLMDAESKLLIAQALVFASPSGAATMCIVTKCAWHLEYGVLGYCKVLQIILQLLSNEVFWCASERAVDLTLDTVLNSMLDYVLPQENEVLEQYLQNMWQCRYLQLLCVARIMNYCDVTSVKSFISPLFVNAFADVNVTVRLCAAQYVHLLLPLFKNTQNVYVSLLQGAGVALVCSTNTSSNNATVSEEEVLEVVALIRGIETMASVESVGGTVTSSTPLLRQALLDLFKLCCSRSSVPSTTNTNPANANPTACRTITDYSRLLNSAMHSLARKLHYATPALLIQEHLRYLIHEWLLLGLAEFNKENASLSQLSSGSQHTSNKSNRSKASTLTLADFPYYLLSPEASYNMSKTNQTSTTAATSTTSTNTSTSMTVNASISSNHLLQSFLRTYSAIIVPIICQLDNTRYRWACILQYAQYAGYNNSDRDIAVIVKRNICALTALQYTLQCAGQLRTSFGNDVQLSEEQQGEEYSTVSEKAHFGAQHIHSFVTRSSSEAELSVYINSKITDTVCEVVLLQLNDALNEAESCGDSSISSISKLLIDTLTMVGAGNNINSLSELFGLCNILDLLAQLHYRLLETRRPSTAIAVLAMLQVLAVHHTLPIQRSTLTVILHVVHCTVCMFPSLILEAVQTIELLTKIVEKFVHTVEDTHKHLVVDLNASGSASVHSTDHSTEEVLSFVPELFAESVLLLKYIAVLLQTSREEGAHAALLVLINSNKLDRQAAESDEFTSSYFSSDSLIQSSSNRKMTVPYNTLQRAATSIYNSTVRILHHVGKTYNNTILAPLLPLPATYLNTCFRKETQVYQKEVQTNTVKQRIRTLIEVIQRRIDGELVCLSYIWLQLKIITQLVIPDLATGAHAATTKGTHTNGSNAVEGVSWERDVDLLSTFLSALIGLCKHCDENNNNTTTSNTHTLDTTVTSTGSTSTLTTHTTSPLQQSLHHSILTLIGHFGAPDLLSLNHTKFPIQAGNIIKNSVFQPESIKLRLLLRVFSMLFTSPLQSRVSHSVLRELSCSGYFTTLQTSTGQNSGCCEGLCNELVAAYSHSVIAREKNALNGANNSTSEQKTRSFVSCWDETRWCTDNKSSYDLWLCGLTFALIEDCFVETAPKSTTPVNTEHPVIPTIDVFLSLLKPVVQIRSDIAEVVFPLVVHFILKTNGVNSYAHSTLSNYITTDLLSAQCVFAQATQLGCNLLTYLMRQDVTDFLAQCTRTTTIAKSESSKSSSVEWSLPFGCILEVDFSFAAKAATRCNLVCTALLFAELSDEADRHSSEHQRRLHSSSNNNNSNIGGSAVVSKPGLHSLLMPIYQGIHDADAIYGIDLCSSLELQALLFTRKGKWMEALCTYEGIIQSRSRGASGANHSIYHNSAMTMAESGIATALGGLGAQFTLGRYSNDTGHSNSVSSDRYGSGLSQWHPSMQDVASHNGSPSADTNRFFTDIHATRARAASPILLTTSADTRSSNITSILQDMQRSTPRAAAVRVAQSSTALFSDILRRMGDETAVNVLRDVAHAQQLTEICEVCDVLATSVGNATVAGGGSTHSAASQQSTTAVLLSRWQARQSHHNTSATAPTESPFALRATLLQRLLSAGRTTAYDAMQCLSRGEVGNSSRSANIAHAVTPQVYKFWNDMTEHIATQRSAGRSQIHYSDTLLTANLAYFECRLLWAKGLKDASIANINYKVIAKLKGLLQEMQTAKSASTSRALGAAPSTSSGRNKTSAANAPAQQEQNEAEAAEYFEEQLTESRTRNLLSEALRTGGEWVSTKRAATGTEILDEYLDPAVQFATGTKELIRAYTTLASFHARLHQNLKAKVQSAEWLQGARVLADRCTEFEECRQLQEQLRREMNNTNRNNNNAGDAATANGIDPRTLYRHVGTLKKEIELDSKEREAVEQSVNRYLVAAVTDFAKVLELSKGADVDCVFRLVQLWLSNHTNPQINALMDDIITSVPSYKFAPLSYQILSRLGGVSDEQSSPNSAHSQARLAEKLREPVVKSGLSRTTTACSTFSGADSSGQDEENEASFQLALCRMVLKLCNEHPHHILPQLFALAHEREFSDESAVHVKKNLSLSRLETATMLVNQLQANPAGRELVVSTRTMLLAYIDLANASTAALQKVGRTKGIKFKEVQARGKRFNEVMGALSLAPAVITLSLPLSPINDYTNIVRIEGFQQTFSITDNGISRPKIISCQGTDGKAYVQLVKGGDDMRQDAVMQQVFANVNYTLSQDEETQKRNLGIRTYKIIPTTPQTGILEWVQNTQAFGTLLCDRDHGAHNRYYPTDWSHGQCREHLKDATDNADKLKRYQDVCSRFHPAFRFFFLEKYADPVQWVASRLAYARSVASNSIIGYILGIGDRHAHNILLDTVTGEVVHIDFGIVFEQGKGLGTPETVPFRLTRDVVDGMGVTACEGTFRRSCEEVLRVLRDNSLQIMTILEVVIHDPLYKWSLSPLQARMKQNLLPDYHTDLAAAKNSRNGRGNGNGNGNGQAVQQTLGVTAATKGGGNFGKDAAERTLRRVLHKLQGQEDPSSGEALSIEGQVDLLLNEARSPHNLSKLFPGWAPWL